MDDSPEKVSLEIETDALERIDLTIKQGMYSSRADFIRTAVENQLKAHVPPRKGLLTRLKRWFQQKQK